jgi:hypothetical protein
VKRGYVFPVLLNGRECWALRETGCNHILFNQSLIDDSFQPLHRSVKLTALFGQEQTLQLFNVSLRSNHFGCDSEIWTPAAAVKGIFINVIMGNSIFDSPTSRDVICRPLTVSNDNFNSLHLLTPRDGRSETNLVSSSDTHQVLSRQLPVGLQDSNDCDLCAVTATMSGSAGGRRQVNDLSLQVNENSSSRADVVVKVNRTSEPRFSVNDWAKDQQTRQPTTRAMTNTDLQRQNTPLPTKTSKTVIGDSSSLLWRVNRLLMTTSVDWRELI